MVVNSRQEAVPLFILASQGDETDRGNNLRVSNTPFLLLTISALGCFACSSAVHSPPNYLTQPYSPMKAAFCYSTKFGVLSPWISNLVIPMYWAPLHHFYFRSLPLSLFWGSLHAISILGCLCTSLLPAPLCLPILGVFLLPHILGVPICFTQTRVRAFYDFVFLYALLTHWCSLGDS